jgi:glutamyl-tRNA synthetase
MATESTKTALNASLRALDSLQEFDSPSIEHTLRALADELGLKVRQLLGVLRVAVTGQRVAPPLFETIEILGRHRTLSAIRAAAGSL